MRRAAIIALVAVALVAGGCRKKAETAANLNAQNKVEVRPVRLFFESEQMLLVAESRNVAISENPAGAIPVVVRELMKGPTSTGFGRLFPADIVVRGAYLLPDGTVIVDLGGKTLSEGWGTGSHQELMAVYSLVQTVAANFAEAKRVRVLVNGMPAETLAGHVSLARSLLPNATLVDPRAR